MASKRSTQEDLEAQGSEAKRLRSDRYGCLNSKESAAAAAGSYESIFARNFSVHDQASLRIGNEYHQTITGATRDDIQQALDLEKSRIIRWLAQSLPDISRLHDSACQKHEETTGSWLLESDEFKRWLNAKNSFLWLNAGAGAGKSILCSTVIEHLRKSIQGEPHATSAVVYWYFSFANNATQDVSNFLCSIVKDLCSKSLNIPKPIQEGYEGANKGQHRPITKELHKFLEAVLAEFSHVYLVVDALDEYPQSDRDHLLSTLIKLRDSNSESLHLFATSRRERDIEQAFLRFGQSYESHYEDIRMQSSHIRQDIQKYIDSQFQKEDKFVKWTHDERNQLKLTLTEVSDGMFRLVALQMESLSKAKSKNDRRKALETLPKSLDSFHERLLGEIPEGDVEITRRALIWLAYSRRPMNLAELAEAILINYDNPDRPFLDTDDRYDEPHDILSLLPAGLVKTLPILDNMQFSEAVANDREEKHHNLFDEDSKKQNQKDFKSRWRKIPVIQMAHFSVLEYLTSNRASNIFRIPERCLGHSILSSASSAYLLFIAQAPETSELIRCNQSKVALYLPFLAQDLRVDFVLLPYISCYWADHMKKAVNVTNDTMDEVLLEVFRDNSNGISPLSLLIPQKDTNFFPPRDTLCLKICHDRTLHWFAYKGLNRQIHLLFNTDIIPRPIIHDNMILMAVKGNNPKTVELLFNADFKAKPKNKWRNPLFLAIKYHWVSLEIVSFLLQSDARNHLPDICLVGGAFNSRDQQLKKLLSLHGVPFQYLYP